jgi:L-alanine-DL-glutamate epimerase-like enolase superfamily enzyme
MVSGIDIALWDIEGKRSAYPSYNAFLEEPLEVRDGALIAPQRPGLGVRLDVAYGQAHAL